MNAIRFQGHRIYFLKKRRFLSLFDYLENDSQRQKQNWKKSLSACLELSQKQLNN